MKISKVEITNFRLFKDQITLDLNAPDGTNSGSGLTVLVGENGCGKSTVLDALSYALLSYKSEGFSIEDINDVNSAVTINLLSVNSFSVKGSMPKNEFLAKGFHFHGCVRNRSQSAYLSSMVTSDTLFIPTNPSKPGKGSPDLRVSVNNPFSGPRFNENDVIYLDKNRTFQTKTGTYNSTRFDRLMEDLAYQYVKSLDNDVPNVNEYFNTIFANVHQSFLSSAMSKFKDMTGINIVLPIIDNWEPFKNAYFAERKENNLQIPLARMGSGYEMLFSLVYSYELSKQAKKQLIVLIDEPEIHMHPNMQRTFAEFILEASKEAQIVMTTHSPLLIKHVMNCPNTKVLICKKDSTPSIMDVEARVLPYISANEVNYLAFQLPTFEFHNELYGYLQTVASEEDIKNEKESNFDNWLVSKGMIQDKQWIRILNGEPQPSRNYTKQTFIRNSIHHPENRKNEPFDAVLLKQSIDEMVGIIKSLCVSDIS